MTDRIRQSLIEYFDFESGEGDVVGVHAGVILQPQGTTFEFSEIAKQGAYAGRAWTPGNDRGWLLESTVTSFDFSESPFWMAFWVRPEAFESSSTIVHTGGTSPQLRVYGSASALTFYLAGTGTNLSFTTDPLPTDQWSLACVDFDHETGIGRIFVNGQLAAQQTHPDAKPVTLVASQGWRLFRAGGAGLSATQWQGNQDEIAVGSGTLTEADVTWLWNSGAGRTYEDIFQTPPTEEEIFRATFADASGQPAYITALVSANDTQRLINHNVSLWAGKPGEWRGQPKWYRIPVASIGYGELHKAVAGKPIFVRADQPGLREGKRLLIMDTNNERSSVGPAELLCLGWEHDE